MKLFSSATRNWVKSFSVFLFITLTIGAANLAVAQQKISRRYPAGKDVRLELKNIAGTITVETWARDEIRVTATMDNRKVNFNPRQTNNGIVIDIAADNRGKTDVGDMNFKIELPARSSVDLETRSGQITVSNIQGELVRAHIWTSGDITLSGVSAARVFATNTTGDIFFDGEFSSGGTYEFKSGKGNITLRLPANCGFRLVATAPTKEIKMGPFWHDGMKKMSEGRRIIGDVGDGRASVTVTNYQGTINFLRR